MWDGELDADFVIIGGGVVGLACAQRLCQQGASVTVVDRGACGNEASWAGGGILSALCPWDYPDEVTRLAGRGAALFSDWAQALLEETGIDPEYTVSGMQVLPPLDRARGEQWCATNRVNFTADANGIFLPEVAQVRNPRLLHALRASVEGLGGRIVEHCEVTNIAAQGGRVQQLQTSCGEMTADSYIVTAGAWSKAVLGEHAMSLDIAPVRGQMLQYRFEAPPIEHIVLQKDLYLIPRRDGHLLVGSTMEQVGFDKSVTETARADLSRRAAQILPELARMTPVRHWAGLRPGSPENIPTIGRHPLLENLYLNSGHFRYGVTMAAASVEILLNDLQGKPQALDVMPYRKGWGQG